MKQLALVKPLVDTYILENEQNEKATYLRVPDFLSDETLASDIGLGATQFREVQTLTEKENVARYILINTDNLEQGYAAVSYLAAILNEREGASELPAGDSDEECDWEENAEEIPIIQEEELKHSVSAASDNGERFRMGGLMSQGIPKEMEKKPYWFYCRREMVCIVAEHNNPFFFERGWNMAGTEDEQLSEALAHFRANRHVFIINLVKGYREKMYEYDAEEDEDTEGSFGDYNGVSVEEERSRWNYIVLSYSADEVNVCFTKDADNKYYKQVLKGILAKKGLEAKRGDFYNRIVNTALAMRDSNKCALLEKIVNYAVKDWSSTRREITGKDFLFLDRFVSNDEKRRLADMAGRNGWNESRKPLSAYERLEQELVGMEEVKQQVRNIVNMLKFNRMRRNMHISGGSYHNVHVMLGAPGTAKTTVAKLMGRIMAEEKLLPSDRFACINGAELKGMYVGHSAPKTKMLFENNDIIVIDEAYSLVDDDGRCDSFSKEAIAQLIIELENHAMDKLVIFAGYGGTRVCEKNNKMEAFLNANPGIRSRINTTIFFVSYTPQELSEIFFRIAKLQNYEVEPSAKQLVCEYFGSRLEDDNFGNDREARSLLETSVLFAAGRVFAKKKKNYARSDMQTILAEDVKMAIAEMRKQQNSQKIRRNRNLGFRPV